MADMRGRKAIVSGQVSILDICTRLPRSANGPARASRPCVAVGVSVCSAWILPSMFNVSPLLLSNCTCASLATCSSSS